MTELEPEITEEEGVKEPESQTSNIVAIVGIVAGLFFVLACISACTFIAYIFLSNPPWHTW